MGFIAALLSKKGEDVSSHLLKMMRSSSPQLGDGYGFATPRGVKTYTRLPDSLDVASGSMLGYELVKVMPNDPAQPVSQYGYTMILDGRLWTEPTDFSAAAEAIGRRPQIGLRNLIERGNGSYIVVVAEKGRILCGRDHIGVVPLYVGESKTLIGAVSNMKMLWSVGISPQTLAPGSVAEMSKSGINVANVKNILQPPSRRIPTEKVVEELDGMFLAVTEDLSRGVFSACLGFSGGIDSSLVAHYLKKAGVRVDLICVGVEGSGRFDEAKRAADHLGLPIRLESFSSSQVEDDLDAVLRSVEEADPMKVSVALPLHWTAKIAIEYGGRVLYSGNGSDELFGGYRKYVVEYAASGEKVAETMLRDVQQAHAVNHGRDYKVCADVGLELRLPFADQRMIEFGLSLPTEMKIAAGLETPRKPILRALASRIGLPEEVISTQKRAVQYSTGVSSALKSLAKKEGTTLSRYLSKRFTLLQQQ